MLVVSKVALVTGSHCSDHRESKQFEQDFCKKLWFRAPFLCLHWAKVSWRHMYSCTVEPMDLKIQRKRWPDGR